MYFITSAQKLSEALFLVYSVAEGLQWLGEGTLCGFWDMTACTLRDQRGDYGLCTTLTQSGKVDFFSSGA